MSEDDETDVVPRSAPPNPAARAMRAARRLDSNPTVVRAVRNARRRLPGDHEFGDALSTAAPDELPAVAGRAIAELGPERPGALKEAGLAAVQVWQAMLGGRARVDRPMTIMFTDIVGFSSWAVRAGDDAAVTLLRAVGEALEPAIRRHRGEVVKRLGDGLMAVFAEPQTALDAVFDGQDALEDVEVYGFRPRVRAGLHTGTPKRLGGDYLGVDVNIAARVVERAAGGEVIVSDATLDGLDTSTLVVRRKVALGRAKGVPADVKMFLVTRREVG
ncbi:MAG TPA: adenylate/guanylate cyclase domain-containing protein [Mycobacteriales bacterium]|nr:adenylate/guanylate cyclase domain-containing protein [Mycobacteriales bacterium]